MAKYLLLFIQVIKRESVFVNAQAHFNIIIVIRNNKKIINKQNISNTKKYYLLLFLYTILYIQKESNYTKKYFIIIYSVLFMKISIKYLNPYFIYNIVLCAIIF